MTVAQPIDREELRILARAHPVAWAMYASGLEVLRHPDGTEEEVTRWRPSPHLLYLGRQLMRLVRGDVKRLAVSMPPGFGKTELISHFFTSWWVGAHPQDKVMICSYQEGNARTMSRDARDSFAEHAPAVWGLGTWTRSSATAWDVFRQTRRQRGRVLAVGRGGALTSKRLNLLVVDDLVKGIAEAMSPTIRNGAWDWFYSDALSRLEPDARVLLVFTRWHHDDLIGRLQYKQQRGEIKGANRWEFVNLPALALHDDPMGRAPGESLWPDRWPAHYMRAIRDDSGTPPSVWQSLYQGRPTAEEGGMFKRDWIRYYHRQGDLITLPEGQGEFRVSDLVRFCVADLAVTTKQSSDYSVITAWGLEPGLGVLVLLDLERVRLEGPELIPRMGGMVKRWRAGAIYVEREAHQLHLLQFAKRTLPVRELVPDKNKKARALPATVLMNAGKVYFHAGAGYLGDLEEELLTFPAGAYDDQVDNLSYAVQVFNDLAGRGPWLPDVPPPPDHYDGDVTSRR